MSHPEVHLATTFEAFGLSPLLSRGGLSHWRIQLPVWFHEDLVVLVGCRLCCDTIRCCISQQHALYLCAGPVLKATFDRYSKEDTASLTNGQAAIVTG